MKFNTSHLPMFVGFDRLFDEMETLMQNAPKLPNWPPYNIKKTSENSYSIELAVAGFGQSDIDLELSGNELKISGNTNSSKDASEYVYKGISERGFERTFKLADSVVVKNAELANGMLRVFLDHQVKTNDAVRKILLVDKSK